jgi:ABC-2 type transport system ATP-binding protein
MTTKPLAVKVKDLSVKFGDFYAVKNVSFEVPPGEIFGFLGANGAGKTTTIRVLCGLLAPTSGSIEIAGDNFANSGSELKMKVGYMSQKFTLYDDLSVDENLNLAADLHRIAKTEAAHLKQELLDFISWSRPMNTMVKDLPGGQKQQVSLVASMMHNPEIVFLDEPTAGVSPAARAKFWELIQQIAKKGKTVFVTTHYMDEAEQCGRIALMRSGELVALDSPSNLKSQTFPRGLIELEPLKPLDQMTLNKLKGENIFSLFEPYGIRYHVEYQENGLTHEQSDWLSSLVKIRKIAPSLEDVFIRIVEGKNR